MTLNQLVKAISQFEGKKVQTSVGNLRETLKVLKKVCKDPAYMGTLVKYLSGVK